MTVRVFLVEDSPVIRHNLTSALEELAPAKVLGFADDEPTAIEWLSTNPDACELILIDIFLRQGSGLNVLRHAARSGTFSKAVVSNDATGEMRTKCAALGAERFFDKSTEIELLVRYCSQLDSGDSGPARLSELRNFAS